MAFTEAQVRALNRNLRPGKVRTRHENGKELSYIEGWHAIAEANRIFGFEGWDRESVDARAVLTRETRGQITVVYIARVRVTVRAGDRTVVREGHGTGEGRGGSPGEAHDLGLKAAETDATKRALATFGKPFGLALYFANGRKDETTADQPTGEALATASTSIPVTVHAWPNRSAQPTEGPATPAQPPLSPAPSRLADRALVVDKSALARPEPRRLRDKQHLRFVALQPCLACSKRPADAHHLGFAQPRALGLKASDEFTVPLCREHHRDLHHSGNEQSWWHEMGIDPLLVARNLWDRSHTRRNGRAAPNGSAAPRRLNDQP